MLAVEVGVLAMNRNVLEHVRNRLALWRDSRTPFSLLRDSLHLKRSGYVAESNEGFRLRLVPGKGEWFTFFEIVVRGDYFLSGRDLRPGDRVIDIGANIGAFSVVAGKKVGPSGRVDAYEPDPETFERLQENVRLNGLTNVVCHNCAVSGSAGRARFFRQQKHAFSSLLTDVDERSPGSAIDVEVVGIRDALAASGGDVNLLKVDCEGSEYEIFDTLDTSSASPVKQISMEVHGVPGRSRPQLMDRLRALGFAVRDTYPLTALRETT
jgi:FkbM family methyltransferase